MNVLEIDSIGGITYINLPFDITSIFCSDSTSTITTSLSNSLLNIQSNNRPEPGANTLTVTDNNYSLDLNIRAGFNIQSKTIINSGDIGISINGVILRNPYALTSPNATTSAPNTIYSIFRL